MTYELFQYQFDYLSKPDNKRMLEIMLEIEMPLIPILADMYQEGVNINMNMLNSLYKKYDELAKVAEAKVYAEIDKYKDKVDKYKIEHPNHKLSDPINLGSPSQLSTLFYKILGYKTKENKTGIDDLEEINTDLTKALIEQKKMTKLIDAFLISLGCGAY